MAKLQSLWNKIKEAYNNRYYIAKAIYLFFKDNLFLLFGIHSHTMALYNQRIKICNSCPHKSYYVGCLLPIGACCSICGCNLRLKLRIEEQHCPLNKW